MIGMGLMKDSPLMQKSKAFALEVIKVCKTLREAKCEGALVVQIHSSIKQAAKSIGINSKGISDVLKGKQPSAGGFFWRFAGQ